MDTLMVCDDCGVVVIDTALHDKWHEQMNNGGESE